MRPPARRGSPRVDVFLDHRELRAFGGVVHGRRPNGGGSKRPVNPPHLWASNFPQF
jgi:hypothetical protein